MTLTSLHWLSHHLARGCISSGALSLLCALTFIALPCPTMHADTNAPPATAKAQNELATFGGGCFWCLEAMFQLLPGVKAVTSGYAGGHTANPTYQEVCSGQIGHAEVVQVEFDPAQISYEKLLDALWDAHDPTTLNRQGNDVGTQYRSIILYHNDAQRVAAEKSKQEIAKLLKEPVVTEIVPLTKFHPAEGYHQDYFRKNPKQAYCTFVVRPKLEKFKKSQQLK